MLRYRGLLGFALIFVFNWSKCPVQQRARDVGKARAKSNVPTSGLQEADDFLCLRVNRGVGLHDSIPIICETVV